MLKVNGGHDNFTQTQVLQNELEHMSDKVQQLCRQVDKTVTLLTEINLKTHEMSSSLGHHEKMLSSHDTEIDGLKETIKSHTSFIKFSKVMGVFISGVVALTLSGMATWNSYMDLKDDKVTVIKTKTHA